MRKKLVLLVATGIFLLLLAPSLVTAEIDTDVMKPGDTFVYKVTEFDVPWEEILGNETPIDMDEFVLDLSGSTLALKCMAQDRLSGHYVLDAYIILGKSIIIPYPNDSVPAEFIDVFGDKLEVPSGIGLGIGGTIPGTDVLDSEEGGLPFYLDPELWDDHEELIEDWAETFPVGASADVTNEDDEFKVEFSGSDENGSINIILIWFSGGPNEGLFKSVDGELTMDFNNDTVDDTISVEISFDEKKHKPLPKEILDEEDIVLEMTKGDMAVTGEGFFDDPLPTSSVYNIMSQLEAFEEGLDDLEGEDIVEYEIKDVEGCYYETEITLMDNPMSEQWWNGFTGFPTSLKSSYSLAGLGSELSTDPWEDFNFNPSVGLVPMMAPGITPDWNMWAASSKLGESVLNIYESIINSASAATELEKLGVTVKEFSITYELRGNKDWKYFFLEQEAEIVWDTADWENYTDSDMPLNPTDTERPKVEATESIKAYIAYTSKGLIAGAGLAIEGVADLTDFPVDDEYQDGKIDIKIDAELKNKDIGSIPDPDDLPKDTAGEEGGGDLTPGFAILPVIVVLAAVTVSIKRRK